jgi:RNA polymerase sigma factor (sigma-70 family)
MTHDVLHVLHGVAAKFFGFPCYTLAVRGYLHSEKIYRSREMRTDDGSIVQECLNGDSGAFGILVDKYKAGIYAYVYDKLRNFQDAQDVTQEVFLQAYRNLRSLRRWESFGFWLFRIARNQCGKWARAQSRRPDREFIEDKDPGVLEAPSMESYRESLVDESLQEALDSLPETYREVLMLHYFGGMSSMEIARAVGTSPTAIRMRLSRARSQLREEMIAMMDTAFEGQRLQASFTFRIVEAVKRIKINPMPRMTGLPWGLSLAAGIAVVVMTLGSQMAIHQSPELTAFPGETQTLKAREIAVDILGAPGTSLMAGKQGDTDGVAMDWRSPEINSLLAPARGGGTWTQKADMPTARCWSGAAVVDGKIYVIGGSMNRDPDIDSVYPPTTAAVEEYDPATDTWTRKADMPTSRAFFATSVVDGIIYAIGGWTGLNVGRFLSTVEAYDPATDTWTRKADMPTRREPCAVTVDGKIYAIGGLQHGVVVVPTVEVYDPATNRWTRKADMPTAREFHAACVIDGRIYVSGGSPTHIGGLTGLATVEVYDPATDTWTQVSDMPMARHDHSASVVDGKVYIIGGADDAVIRLWEEGKIDTGRLNELFSIVYVYDPGTDTWTTAADPLPTARGGLTAAVVDGKIYAIGGGQGSTKLSRVEEYDPGLPGDITVISPAGKLLRTWGEVKSQ